MATNRFKLSDFKASTTESVTMSLGDKLLKGGVPP